MKRLEDTFESFDESIKYEGNKLEEKKVMLEDEIKKLIKEKLEENNYQSDFATIEDVFIQGSYFLNTTINDETKIKDIDMGLVLNIRRDIKDEDAFKLKEVIKDCIERDNRNIEYKDPCITVTYMKDKKEDYHVDIALYILNNSDYFLCRGKGKQTSRLEEASPYELKDFFEDAGFGPSEETHQVKITRLMKYWIKKDFSEKGENTPPSIGYTLHIARNLNPESLLYNSLLVISESLLNEFRVNGEYYDIKCFLPVKPETDVYTKMSDKQKTTYHNKLHNFVSKLDEAIKYAEAGAVSDATDILRELFGDKFPKVKNQDDSIKSPGGGIPGNETTNR